MIFRLINYVLLIIISLAINSLIGQELTPGDGIRITLYNVSDNISGDYFIQQEYSLRLPFIGLIDTKDQSFKNIKNLIIAEYKKIYRNPEISVEPLYRIKILGEVREPGIYFVTGIEKLSDVLAIAGGETEDANLDKIYFVKKDNKININAKEMLEEGVAVRDIGLKSGVQIYIPKRAFRLRTISVIFSGVAVTAAVIGLFLR